MSLQMVIVGGLHQIVLEELRLLRRADEPVEGRTNGAMVQGMSRWARQHHFAMKASNRS